MTTEALILAGIGTYLVLMFGIAYYASRNSHSLVDFVVAGRKLPLWLCSVTIFATWFGSGTLMGAATAAYEGDRLMMLSEPFGSALSLLIAGVFFARILRRTRRMTWPELLEARFGRVAGTIGSLADLLSDLIWLGGILFTFGVLLESLTGAPMLIGVYGGLLIVVVYTMIGGMWAVAFTDLVQTLILIVGLLVLLVAVLNEAGGWGAISAGLADDVLRPLPRNATIMDWVDTIHIFMAMGLAAVAANSTIQRALAARNEHIAKHAYNLAALAYLAFGIVPLLLGLAASVLLPDLDDPNAVLTELAVTYLHPALTAVVIGSLLAAIMSTADSILLSASAIVSTNLLPLAVRNPDERLRLRVARLSIPIIGLASTYVALNANRVIEVLLDSAAVLLAAVIVPFVACFWWDKANQAGALASIFAGIVTWRVAAALETSVPADLLGFCASAIALLVVTLVTQRADPPRPLTDVDGNIVELQDRC